MHVKQLGLNLSWLRFVTDILAHDDELSQM
jgi:hypothetical protein